MPISGGTWVDQVMLPEMCRRGALELAYSVQEVEDDGLCDGQVSWPNLHKDYTVMNNY